MSIEIKVNIEGLNQLTESLALIGSALAYKNDMVKTSSEAVNVLLETTDKIEDCTKEDNEEEVKKEVVEKVVTEVVKEQEKKGEESAITIEDVREVFVAKNNIKGNTPKLKKILNKFGVKKVTDLEEKNFAEVLSRLKEL